MKCPLYMIHISQEPGEVDLAKVDCIGGECAWWVKASESCAMEAIPRIIGYLGSELKGIKDKMPSDLLEELRLLVGACGMIADKMPSRR